MDPNKIPERPPGHVCVEIWDEQNRSIDLISATGRPLGTASNMKDARQQCGCLNLIYEEGWAECRKHAIGMAENEKGQGT
jgi:hypothetical protein